MSTARLAVFGSVGRVFLRASPTCCVKGRAILLRNDTRSRPRLYIEIEVVGVYYYDHADEFVTVPQGEEVPATSLL